jgi:glucosamine-6-phosphate deaminase
MDYTKKELYEWCRVPLSQLATHPNLKIPLRICKDSQEMGQIMARELVYEIMAHNEKDEPTNAIIPCGPTCWYQPFTELVNRERISLRNLVVFHMDESLDWQGRELPYNHPFNFRGYMEQNFYNPIFSDLAVPQGNRYWLSPRTLESVVDLIAHTQIDITYGGLGQDGHIAYNQARRQPYSQVTLDELRQSSARIQENNLDTILAIAQRNFGSAYQFVPPMSVTLGVKECLSARKVRIFTDTGAWKQTAVRVALFGPLTVEYPITLLQEHPDALITATEATASHPISEHPEWDLLTYGENHAS